MEDRFPLFILILHYHPVHFTVDSVREEVPEMVILRGSLVLPRRSRRIERNGRRSTCLDDLAFYLRLLQPSFFYSYGGSDETLFW
jgi:hypothetical protein